MLAKQLQKYLAHKLNLAKVSMHYKAGKVWNSVVWAQEMYWHLKFRHLNDKETANLIWSSKQHLENLLPYEGNKSYKSSYENLTNLLTRCRELLQPKKQEA